MVAGRVSDIFLFVSNFLYVAIVINLGKSQVCRLLRIGTPWDLAIWTIMLLLIMAHAWGE